MLPGFISTGFIGASPDAIVVDKVTSDMIGLCEFKAPVHHMYAGIPRQDMVQMQGQMAVTGNYAGIPRQYMVQMQGQMAVTGNYRNRLHFYAPFVMKKPASY